MGRYYNTNYVSNGLIFCVDPGNVKSYPGSGTSIKDMSVSGQSCTVSGTYNGSNAFTFNGSGNKISTPGMWIGNEFTFDMWLNVTGPVDTSNRRTLFGSSTASGGFELSSIATILFRFYDTINLRTDFINISIPGPTYHPIGSNYHLVLSKSAAGRFNLYNNGVQQLTNFAASGSTASGLIYTNWTVPTTMIALYQDFGTFGGGRNFAGSVYRQSIYNKELTAQEVLQNFEASRKRYNV